jgi:lipopolysaccharide/colanic/teichoic acid biosynthesis glycosyltransferase
MQRFFDIIFSLLAIILLLPLFVIIMLILRFTGEGEIFFCQSRIGINKQEINILKFATMKKNSPSIGTGTITLKDDPRVLPFGKFLRKTKINELPQLLNILMGELSFIGPRPQTSQCFEAFPTVSQEIIAQITPGLSGVGSIVFRNEEDILGNSLIADELYKHNIMPYKGELEEWYVKNQSILLYFILIFSTICVLFLSKRFNLNYFLDDLPKIPAELQEYIK